MLAVVLKLLFQSPALRRHNVCHIMMPKRFLASASAGMQFDSMTDCRQRKTNRQKRTRKKIEIYKNADIHCCMHT